MGGTSATDEYCSIGARLWQSTDKHHVVAARSILPDRKSSALPRGRGGREWGVAKSRS